MLDQGDPAAALAVRGLVPVDGPRPGRDRGDDRGRTRGVRGGLRERPLPARLPAASRSTRRRSGSCARPGRSFAAYRALRERYGILELAKTPDAVRRGHADAGPRARRRRGRAVRRHHAAARADGRRPPDRARGRADHRPADPLGGRRRGAAAVRARAASGSCSTRSASCARELDGRAGVIGFSGAPFTLACYLIEGRPSRDFAVAKAFMYREPEAWHELMDRLTTMIVAYLRAQVAAGAQVVQLFDSWVGGLGPADYETYVQPHVRRIFDGTARHADDPLRDRHRGAPRADGRRPAATSSGSTTGSRSPTRGGASAPDRGSPGQPGRGAAARRLGGRRRAGARTVLDEAAGRPGPRLQPRPRRPARRRTRTCCAASSTSSTRRRRGRARRSPPPEPPRDRGRAHRRAPDDLRLARLARARGRRRVPGARAWRARARRRARRRIHPALPGHRRLAADRDHPAPGRRPLRRRSAGRSRSGCGSRSRRSSEGSRPCRRRGVSHVVAIILSPQYSPLLMSGYARAIDGGSDVARGGRPERRGGGRLAPGARVHRRARGTRPPGAGRGACGRTRTRPRPHDRAQPAAPGGRAGARLPRAAADHRRAGGRRRPACRPTGGRSAGRAPVTNRASG